MIQTYLLKKLTTRPAGQMKVRDPSRVSNPRPDSPDHERSPERNNTNQLPAYNLPNHHMEALMWWCLNLYMLPLGQLICSCNVSCLLNYTDDTQIYVTLTAGEHGPVDSLCHCIEQISVWMQIIFSS